MFNKNNKNDEEEPVKASRCSAGHRKQKFKTENNDEIYGNKLIETIEMEK